tara:strand:- start:382 stop:1104 length:723 start_codon:yes stop_codon:yes gene_type:complete
MSPIEILRVLYDDVLRYDPERPDWEDRDRLVFSKGHGCLALYAILADKEFFPRQYLPTFCREGSILGGHPERGKVPGVEASTGALGHGLSIAVGMALAAKRRGHSHRVFAVMGDGEINEGSVWEALMTASKYRLSNLTAMVDYNKIQSYGFVDEVQPLEPLVDKFRAFGCAAVDVDGHDVDALRELLASLPIDSERPTAIVCHTVKGKGIPFSENDPKWHHKSRLLDVDIEALYSAVGGR